MIKLTPEQKKALEKLWFEFGNKGPKHTHGNHRFIQELLERGEDSREFYRRPGRVAGWLPVTPECERAVDKIVYA